jgi:glutaredoxin
LPPKENLPKDVCPYCKKTGMIPHVAYMNTENYGSGSHKVRCNHCKKVVQIYMKRMVRLIGVEKTESEDADW